MSATITAVPTLGATTLLKDPSEIIAYQIRQFATTPRSLSAVYEDQVISLGDIISRSAQDSQAIVGPTTTALTTVFNRIFGSGATLVSVTTNQYSAALYSLVISVQVTINGKSYGISSTVQVSNGVLVLENDEVPAPT